VASYGGCGCAGSAVVTLTDEGTLDAGVAKRRQQKIYSDPLGRTIKTEVFNWQGGSVYSTTVNTYNALDQITLVRQYQGAESSGVHQDTTMTYDGYGRLKTRHVPEQDPNTATTYNYNADDTPLSVVDARGASQTFTHNNRHLVTGIAYAAPGGIATTPSVSFNYDDVGNRTSMNDGMGSVTYGYNQLSRMTSEARTFSDASNSAINGVTKTVTYDYNLAGELKSITDPAGATINYAFDATGRLDSVTGSSFAGVTTYASGTQYRAWGALKHLTYGNAKTLSATYNARLQAASFNIPGVMSKTYDYYADGQLRFSSDLMDHRFDRSYSHDQIGRLKEAFSGAEARGETPTNDRPYKETFAYDGFSHLTNRTSTNWNDVYSTSDSYTNHRRDGWSYDAEGDLSASVDATYSYDAAGDIRTAGTYEPQSTTTRDLDGDGQQLKTVESIFSETAQAWTTTTIYYVHSTVLGGQVLTELGTDGAKTRTFVYAGGTVLAWQRFYGPNPAVEWEHRDASGASFRTTDIVGSPWGSGPDDNPAELDPTGADAGTHAPLISPNPPDENSGSLTPYPSFMDAASGLTRTYGTEGITVTVDDFMRTLAFRFHGSSLEMADYLSRASAPRLRNYEVALYHRRLNRDFGLNENAARSEALETNSTLIRNWLVNDNWSFTFTFLPQNASAGTSLGAKKPYVDQKVLNSCTEDYFGVTLNTFDESRVGHAGSFTGTGPSYLPNNPNGSGGTATFKITNSLDYSNAQLTAYNNNLKTPGEPTSGPIIGLTIRGAPLKNYTGTDNGPMQMLMTQVHELGHSLDAITQIGYDIPENHSGKKDLGGKILEDCVRKRGGFKYR
jgi:YD repeat-containing protein